ncbi:putative monooxygenase [Nocardioides sp. PD653]|nr:Putative monooxygenase [Nocardioides sp. PD653-B2]GAW57303.1 putative monooxygenase [Nocardioides sp. PD653]
MNNIKLRMTAQIPSGFGMPVSGHAFDVHTVVACARLVDVQGTTVSAGRRIERDLVAGITGTKAVLTGDMGSAYFPGTSAWRPPNC